MKKPGEGVLKYFVCSLNYTILGSENTLFKFNIYFRQYIFHRFLNYFLSSIIFNNTIIEILLSAGFYLPQTNIFFPWLRIAADLQPISAVLLKYMRQIMPINF